MESARKVPDDIRNILAEVCAEYRIRIDPDDPAVAIVMLNRLVLELALDRAVERIEAAAVAVNAQVSAVQVRIGAVLAQELRSALKVAANATSASAGLVIAKPTLALGVLAVFTIGLLAGALIR